MPTGILDSFQLIVGLYLYYVAIKGSGQMYRFGDMDEETKDTSVGLYASSILWAVRLHL